MKFINLKSKKGKIIFSEEITICELIDEKEKIFQKIDSNSENIIEKLKLYTKKLKRLTFEIIFEEFYFKNIDIEMLEDEVSEENTEKYIEYFIKESLGEDDIESYFIKYFKKEKEFYTVFVFDREFIEDIIEFFLENKIKVEKILIKNENFILDNYDLLLKRKLDTKFNIGKGYIFLFLLIITFSSLLKIYNVRLENNIDIFNKNIISEEEKLNSLKLECDSLEKDIDKLVEKIENYSNEKECFSEKILRILEMIPKDVMIENIYFEKNIFTIKGYTNDETSLFKLSKILENDIKIKKVVYDYITKKENRYDFFLELRIE